MSAADVDARVVGQQAVADLASVPSDIHASADYRARVGAQLVHPRREHAVAEAMDA